MCREQADAVIREVARAGADARVLRGSWDQAAGGPRAPMLAGRARLGAGAV